VAIGIRLRTARIPEVRVPCHPSGSALRSSYSIARGSPRHRWHPGCAPRISPVSIRQVRLPWRDAERSRHACLVIAYSTHFLGGQ